MLQILPKYNYGVLHSTRMIREGEREESFQYHSRFIYF